MSNIRDLQKLRGQRNIHIYNNTLYLNANPETRTNFYEQFMETKPITTRPFKKFEKESDEIKNKVKAQFHRRGGSIATPGMIEKQSPAFLQVPRLSIYSISMRGDNSRKESPMLNTNNYPATERKERDRDLLGLKQLSSLKKNSIGKIKIANQQISANMFQVQYAIGKGGFGKVWKVSSKKTKQVFAMKLMSKAKVINKKSVNSVMNERIFLERLSHPFLVNMTYAFQDRQNLYLIMDYLDGGDLRYHLGNKRFFSQKETKFFIANIIIGLEYMHRQSIIHRDIKPENLVLDSHGYLRITDMGISRQYRQHNAQDTSGTPGYMAPQVMMRKKHSFQVDYFALGVIAYEFMLGRRPYQGQNRNEIKEHMLAKQAQVKINQLPFKWSPHSINFINELLQRNPEIRLGHNGIQEIKNHPWLSDIDWDKMITKQLKAPFQPISIEQDYQNYKEQISEDTLVDDEEVKLILRDKETQNLFQGYYFERSLQKPQKITSNTTNTSEENQWRR